MWIVTVAFRLFIYLDDGINWNKGDASTVPHSQVVFNFGGAEVKKCTFLIQEHRQYLI